MSINSEGFSWKPVLYYSFQIDATYVFPQNKTVFEVGGSGPTYVCLDGYAFTSVHVFKVGKSDYFHYSIILQIIFRIDWLFV